MLDRYRPKELSTQDDAARTARFAVEHERARERFLAAERRKRGVAILLLCAAFGCGAWFFAHYLQGQHALTPVPAQSSGGQPRVGKDLATESAVREAVVRALQSRGLSAPKGTPAVLPADPSSREPAHPSPEKPPEPSR